MTIDVTGAVPSAEVDRPAAEAAWPQLLRELTVASELEHGLCLQYLFTAFSLKQSLDEGGLLAHELTTVRKWRANLLFIAAQEMLHLAQAANIGTAIGGGAVLRRPNFPQRPDYYPTDLPWGLWPFSSATLVLYALYERPESPRKPLPSWLSAPDAGARALAPLRADAPAAKDPFTFLPARFPRPRASRSTSIAALYRRLAQNLRDAGDIFHGSPQAQVAAETVDFPQLIRVEGLAQALAGIELITLQGEGSPSDRADSHFGMFVAIYEEYARMKAQRSAFDPVRDVQANPLSRLHADNTYPGWRLIQDADTRAANDLCSDVYALMLLTLAQVFTPQEATQAERRAFANVSLRLMTGVIAALGDVLTRMPMGDDSPGSLARPKCAGPSFELDLIQPAIGSASVAWRYVAAQLAALRRRAAALAARVAPEWQSRFLAVAATLDALRAEVPAQYRSETPNGS